MCDERMQPTRQPRSPAARSASEASVATVTAGSPMVPVPRPDGPPATGAVNE